MAVLKGSPAGAGGVRSRSRGAPFQKVRRAGMVALAVPFCAGLPGCASLPPLPLRPEPVAYADTLPIREPKEREPVEVARFFEAAVIEEFGQVLDTRRWAGRKREALNLTHFDDVVASAWFEHRIGARPLAPEEVRLGPGAAPGPDTTAALLVTGGKPGGLMPGFVVRDATGARFLFKLDPPGYPGLASSADVIASRLLHAAGYHTPSDQVVVFRPDRLRLAPGATVRENGVERPMTPADLAALLARTDTLADGRVRALASRFVEGRPKGPTRFEGRRKDDPNDHYRHEYRREVRGLYVFAAWLNHVDIREGNTLDTYIDPPGYLRHYLIDFGSTLGSGGVRPHRPREGREYNFDLWPTMARLASLGFYRVGWEGPLPDAVHPGVGWLPIDAFDPGRWKPNWPTAAWRLLTPADGYWAAKIIAAFRDEHLRAAVEAGQPTDARAADILLRALRVRRDRTVRYWYSRVTPVEAPRLEPRATGTGANLRFLDRGIADGVRAPGGTRYAWEWSAPNGRLRARGEAVAAGGAEQKLEVPIPACTGSGAAQHPDGRPRPGGGTLELLRVRVASGSVPEAKPRPALVYLMRTGDCYRVVGLFH